MEAVSQALADAKATVFGTDSTSKNEEPPSGITGKGTADSPYDQGNAPEQSALDTGGAPTGEEPPSGVTGKGTLDSPYDQGNAPEKSADPTIVVQTESDKKNASTIGQESSSSPGIATLPSPTDPLASASTTHQGSGDPTSIPTPQQEKVIHESRGRDETAQRTTSTMLSPEAAKTSGTAANGGNFDASKTGAGKEANRLRYERSVSPGQLPDGTHVQCSGDRGQNYTPGNKFSDKLKDKFHFGHKK